MRMLQVCNVGRIVGGTAACAWTVTRALPDVEHCVVFLSEPCGETRRAFASRRVEVWRTVDEERVRKLAPDVVLLHNTSAGRVRGVLQQPTIQYVHSRGSRLTADRTVYCSRWLAGACGEGSGAVLLQGVPRPLRAAGGATRELRERLVVGRICTPTAQKWPGQVVEFYTDLAARFSDVDWEFIGCPPVLQVALQHACRGRATFAAASWGARSRLWTWDAMLYHHPEVTESFGRTVAECMRAGCIPVVDDRGGFREQVPAGCGYLCREERDFGAALTELLDPTNRRRGARAAMAHADDEFSVERFRSRLLRVLRTL